VAWDSARKRELAEQSPHAGDILSDLGVDFAVGSLEIGIGHHGGPAMARTANIDDVQIPVLNDSIEVHVDEVEARAGTPMPK
jgi:hypothetical protein